MPSPFPGMDPYLESPAHWPDFHDALATELRTILNHSLPAPYYAQLAVREQIGVFSEGVVRRIVPDLTVSRPMHPAQTAALPGGATALDEARTDISESVLFEIELDREEIPFVEIRDAVSGHEVVTVIEILSPSNKQPGLDRDNYLRKRTEILDSATSLIEIDLLRDGGRTWAGAEVEARIRTFDPPPDYVVLVNRASFRPKRQGFQIFQIFVTSSLPVIPVPLRHDDAEVPLDLQLAFRRTFEGGPYSRTIDYSLEPVGRG